MWITLWILIAMGAAEAGESGEGRSIMEQMLKLMENTSDLRLPPTPNLTMNIPVDVGLYVNAIGEIDEMNMDFSVNVYFRQVWVDHRLAWAGQINYTGPSIALPDAFIEDIWKPDTFIENGKDERTHTVTKENRSFRIYADGKIFYSQRLTLKVWCNVYLLNFPLDDQTCRINMMSYRYTAQELKLQWLAGKPIENFDKVKLSRFSLLNVTKGDCTTGFSTGAYSCIYVEFNFVREFGYYMIQIYVPSGLIVLLSWVSFWLDPLAVPGRITLGVLTVLSMSTQMASAATSALPKVSYIKAIDIWLTTCMIFLFAALVEFAVVNSLARRDISKANKLVPDDDEPKLKVFVHKVLLLKQATQQAQEAAATQSNGSSTDVASQGDVSIQEGSSGQCRFRISASIVDIISRILFPLMFLGFNAAYWAIYLH